MSLPRLVTNKSLTGQNGEKVYNAYYRGSNFIFTPVVQRPSGRLTYMWRSVYASRFDEKGPYDSAKEALAAAVASVS